MAPVRMSPSTAEELFDRGESARRKEQPSEALACFREALEKDPGFELAQEWIDTLLLQHPELLSRSKTSENHSIDPGKGISGPWWLQHAVALVALAFALEFGYGCWRLLQGSAVCTEGDHYSLLQVGRDATTEEVSKAFREKSKEAHPDKCKEAGCDEAFLAYTRAAEVLRDPAERKIFDLSGETSLSPRCRQVLRFGLSDSLALLFAKLCGHSETFAAIHLQHPIVVTFGLPQYDDNPIAMVMHVLLGALHLFKHLAPWSCGLVAVLGTLHFLKHLAPWSCGLVAVLGLASIKA